MKYVAFILMFFYAVASNEAVSQPISLRIDWAATVRNIPENAYGVNSPANFIPAYSNDGVFMNNLRRITQKKGLIRLHGWGMIDENSPESWLDNGEWNATKIQKALTPLIQNGYEVMINIPSGVRGEDDYQDPLEFARFCADLVQIVNIDNHLNVKYWEIPNEREADFISPGLTVSQMSNLIRTASQAMKLVDSTILVGGSATAWVNHDYLTPLIQITPEMDFVTCHTYAGDCTNSLPEIYDNAQEAISELGILRQKINELPDSTYRPIFLTEYNLSYQGCPDIQSYKGVVYDAIIMTQSIKSGIDATCYWNVAPYSDMSIIEGDDLVDNAYLYEIMNTHFHGEMVQSNSSDSTKILVYATKNTATHDYSFCLINRTNSDQHIMLHIEGFTPDTLHRYLWDASHDYLSDTKSWTQLNNGNFTLSPYSVTVFVGRDKSLNNGNHIGLNNCLVSPNPTSGLLYLKSDENIKAYQIFTSMGRLIKNGVGAGNVINLSGYPDGLYFIRLYSRSNHSTEVTITKE